MLLANRLDGDNHFKYTAITVPLFVSLITMICLSFGSKGGNQCKYYLHKLIVEKIEHFYVCLWVNLHAIVHKFVGKFKRKS